MQHPCTISEDSCSTVFVCVRVRVFGGWFSYRVEGVGNLKRNLKRNESEDTCMLIDSLTGISPTSPSPQPSSVRKNSIPLYVSLLSLQYLPLPPLTISQSTLLRAHSGSFPGCFEKAVRNTVKSGELVNKHPRENEKKTCVHHAPLHSYCLAHQRNS